MWWSQNLRRGWVDIAVFLASLFLRTSMVPDMIEAGGEGRMCAVLWHIPIATALSELLM